jgi:large subunit ribosomal protein L17
MKHGVRFWEKKLNRTPEHRAALLKNLITSLVTHEKIETTVAKAKYMKRATDLVG